EKLERKSLCPLDIFKAISTTELSDAGPTMPDMKRERNPGVRCSDFVRVHAMSQKPKRNQHKASNT
ncbi:MAG: hypothetical protein O2960_28465, partial [Verrucomicrobia bacterium]|nr:hypothetical protein [Verrucomicrobiota bacterium]